MISLPTNVRVPLLIICNIYVELALLPLFSGNFSFKPDIRKSLKSGISRALSAIFSSSQVSEGEVQNASLH